VTLLQHEALERRLNEQELPMRLIVVPLLEKGQIGEASIDLRLGSEFIEARRRSEEAVDPFRDETLSTVEEDRYEIPFGEHLVIHPGQFLLGATFEFIRLPRDIGGQVLGRSSWGRFGLVVATAVTVQPGFRGCLTLELQNLGTVPMRLYPGLRIAQLVLWTTEAPITGDLNLEPPPLGPVSRKLGWTQDELERLKIVHGGVAGDNP
jgi:dCTP deaminase